MEESIHQRKVSSSSAQFLVSGADSCVSFIKGHSSAQTHLRKIISTILLAGSSSCSGNLTQPENFLEESSSLKFKTQWPENATENEFYRQKNVLGIDLNLRLGFCDDKGVGIIGEEGVLCSDSAWSGVGGEEKSSVEVHYSSVDSGQISVQKSSSEGECDPKSGQKSPEKTVGEFSGVTNQVSKPVIGESFNGTDSRPCSDQTVRIVYQDDLEPSDIGKSTLTLTSSFTKEGCSLEFQREETREEADMAAGFEFQSEKVREFKREKVRKEAIRASSFELGKEKVSEEGCLGLLLEAVRLVSGDFDDSLDTNDGEEEQKPEENRETKDPAVKIEAKASRNNKRRWMVDFYSGFEDFELAPVVKSKRGRNQVLPRKYRDSVLEPWKRLPR
ncbi:hypothetical protein AMTRI_Chr11g93470 [Amborella trichopoda]